MKINPLALVFFCSYFIFNLSGFCQENSINSLLSSKNKLDETISYLAKDIKSRQLPDGHWDSANEVDTSYDAKFFLLGHALGKVDESLRLEIINRLINYPYRSKENGGWLLTPHHKKPDHSITGLNLYTLERAGIERHHPAVRATWRWFISNGGLEKVNIFILKDFYLFDLGPENIVDEIEMLVKKFGVKEIHFEDDNFTLKKSFAMQVCELILKRNLKFHWACPNGVRLDTLDKELLQLMEKSGCYSMALGIESGSEKILKSVKKGVTPEKMLEKIKLIRRVTNIRLHGFFIFGFPGETIDDLRQTEDFIMNTPLHRMVVGMFKPLPGTALFEQLKMQKLIPDKNINFAKLTNFSLEPDIPFSELPTNILMQRVKNIQLKFYLRPKIMLGLLREIHSYSQIKYATKYLLYLLGIVKDH